MIQVNLLTKPKQIHRHRKQTCGYQRGKVEGDTVGDWDGRMHTSIFKIDNQHGPAIEHRELYLILCNDLYGKRTLKRVDICICITESLCCTPDTNTTL